MSKSMLISVIIPVYNGEKYIKEAIDSVMQQNHVDLELIIVNDGSTDNTNKNIEQYQQVVASPFKILYYQQAHKGLATAFNYGLNNANGDYLAFIDADDIWHPNKLAIQISALNAQPHLDMVFCHCQQFYSPELSEQQSKKIYCPKRPMPGLTAVGMLIKHSSLQQVGGYNIK